MVTALIITLVNFSKLHVFCSVLEIWENTLLIININLLGGFYWKRTLFLTSTVYSAYFRVILVAHGICNIVIEKTNYLKVVFQGEINLPVFFSTLTLAL